MSDVHTKRRLTRTATGAYLQYIDFDPTGWHPVSIDFESTKMGLAAGILQNKAGNTQPLSVAAPYQAWCDEHAPECRHIYDYEPKGGEFRNFITVWFPPDAADKAMLFKLTHGGRA